MIRRWKRLLLVSALPGLMCAAAPPPPIKSAFAPVEIKQTMLADGVYQFTIASDGYVEQLNSVAVITDTDVLLFDTTTRTSTARAILADLRKITPKPVRYLVNSHWHPDHWSGNSVFVDAFPNVEIIASERERDLMLNMAPFIDSYMPKEVAEAEKTVADLVASGRDDLGAPLTPAKKDELELEVQRVRDLVTE